MSYKIRRTYPAPDSPADHLGARERAMAVFKYLLDIEPERATKHPLFWCIKAAFEQHARRSRHELQQRMTYLMQEHGDGVSAEQLLDELQRQAEFAPLEPAKVRDIEGPVA